MEHTPNLGLSLPTYVEEADVEVLNENFEILDGIPKMITDAQAPMLTVGAIQHLGYVLDDPKWLPCNGQTLDPAEYPELFEKIGYGYGGITFSTVNTGSPNNLTGICWSEERKEYVAVAGARTLTSPDCLVWTLNAAGLPGTNASAACVIWVKELGIYVAAGSATISSATRPVSWSSPDGKNWTMGAYYANRTGSISMLVWCKEINKLVGSVSTYVIRSSDGGATWIGEYAASATILDMCWAPGLARLFFVIGATGQNSYFYLYSSSDAVTFANKTIPIQSGSNGATPAYSVSWSETLKKLVVFVELGNMESVCFYSSPNGEDFYLGSNYLTGSGPNSSAYRNAVLWVDEWKMFIATPMRVAGRAVQVFSNSGLNWSIANRPTGSSYNLSDLNYSKSLNRLCAILSSYSTSVHILDISGFALPKYNYDLANTYIKVKE